MEPLTEPQVRASFVNCSKGEATRLHLTPDLLERDWDATDVLGWRDPRAPERAYLVAPHDGRTVGLVLRAPRTGVGRRRSMCSLCLTVRSGGVSLMVAPRAGRAGQRGHSAGTYICADLSCSAAVRDRDDVGGGITETLTVEQRVDRLVGNLHAFVARVLRQDD